MTDGQSETCANDVEGQIDFRELWKEAERLDAEVAETREYLVSAERRHAAERSEHLTTIRDLEISNAKLKEQRDQARYALQQQTIEHETLLWERKRRVEVEDQLRKATQFGTVGKQTD